MIRFVRKPWLFTKFYVTNVIQSYKRLRYRNLIHKLCVKPVWLGGKHSAPANNATFPGRENEEYLGLDDIGACVGNQAW